MRVGGIDTVAVLSYSVASPRQSQATLHASDYPVNRQVRLGVLQTSEAHLLALYDVEGYLGNS
jgi:hypothetical protein